MLLKLTVKQQLKTNLLRQLILTALNENSYVIRKRKSPMNTLLGAITVLLIIEYFCSCQETSDSH